MNRGEPRAGWLLLLIAGSFLLAGGGRLVGVWRGPLRTSRGTGWSAPSFRPQSSRLLPAPAEATECEGWGGGSPSDARGQHQRARGSDDADLNLGPESSARRMQT